MGVVSGEIKLRPGPCPVVLTQSALTRGQGLEQSLGRAESPSRGEARAAFWQDFQPGGLCAL